MEAGPPEQDGTAAAPKKSAYENLDKSELINKCKGLLQLAKSAKQTKDEYAVENGRLKETVAALQQQRADDKDNLGVLQTSLRKLNDTVAVLEEQKILDKDYMKGMHEMVDELTNEKDTLDRRVQRLTKDNDKLLSDCRQSDGILKQLHDSMAAHQKQVQQLQLMCEQQKVQNTELRQQLAAETQRTQRAEAQAAHQLERCQSYEAKVRLYRSKLVGFAGQVKELRVCKEVMRSTVTEYSQDVSKWRADLMDVSNRFFTQNAQLSAENGVAPDERQRYEARIAELETHSQRLQQETVPSVPEASTTSSQTPPHDADSACAALLLSLDDTLQAVASESNTLQENYLAERRMLLDNCEHLEAALRVTSAEVANRENIIVERDQQVGELTARLQRIEEDNRQANATLLLERDTLIEKGQHLIAMVEELQLNLQRSDGELQQKIVDGSKLVQEHDRTVEELRTNEAELRHQLLAWQEVNERIRVENLKLLEEFGQFKMEHQQIIATAKSEVAQHLERMGNLQEQMKGASIVAENLKEQHNAELSRHRDETQSNIQRMDKIRDELNARESEVGRLQEQLSELKNSKDLQSKCNEIDTLATKVASLQEELSNESESSKMNTEKMEALRSQLIEREAIISRMDAEAKSALEQLSVLNGNTTEELQTKTNEIEILKLEVKSLQAELTAATETSKTESVQFETLHSQVNEREADNNKLQTEVISLQEEIRKVNAITAVEIQSKSDEIQSLHLEIDMLRGQLAKADKSAELDKLQSQLVQRESQIAELQTEVESSLTQITTLNGIATNDKQSSNNELESLRSKCESLQKEKEALLVSAASCKEEIEQLGKQLTAYRNTIDETQAEVIASKAILSVQQAKSSEELQKKTDELEAVRVELDDKLFKQKESTHEELQKTASECEALRNELAEHTNTLSEERATAERDQQRIVGLCDELQQRDSAHAKLVETLQEQIATIRAECDVLRDQQSRHDQAASDLGVRLASALQSAEQANVDRDNVLSSKTREMDDLLSEMRELNEALRNRGDVISKQEQRIAALGAELSERAAAAERTNAERDALEERLHEAEAAGRNASLVVADDQLSTSTISRVEEVSRMRDIEDSFEEKYNKLRALAVKLKRKCSEQAQRLEEFEAGSKSSTSGTVLAASVVPVDAQQARNRQQIQREHDKLLDELDSVRAASKAHSARADALATQLADVQAELNALSAVGNQKSSLDAAVKEYVKQIAAQKDELGTLKHTLTAAEEERTAAQKTAQARADELERLAADLKKAKAALKKTNVLSLEMEAQEKSLLDISHKLEAKIAIIDELNASIEQQQDQIASFKQQIHSIEAELHSEQSHSAELKAQIDAQLVRIRESDSQRADAQSRHDDVQRKLANTEEELLDMRTNADQSAGELERSIAALRSDNQQLKQRVAAGDQTIVEAQAKLTSTVQELEALRTDFVAYKIRAQSQLRQNQQQETSRECELEDELTAERAVVAVLNGKVMTLQQQIKQLDIGCAEQRNEVERLRTQNAQLIQVADEARVNADALQTDIRRSNVEHQDALRTVRLQSETLSACYKKEIADLQASVQEMQYQKQLQHQQQQQLKPADANRNAAPDAQSAAGSTHPMLMRLASNSDEQHSRGMLPHPEWSLLERQAGEGSESIPNSTTTAHLFGSAQQRRISTASSGRNAHELMPLDELLSTSFDATAPSEVLPFDDDADEDIDMDAMPSAASMTAARHRLHVQESRVKHLTTLLAESERDAARLTQLNDALKEEVRRQERSEEREQHLHNLEYLKNVMFKFLTINQGDEKAHLVPVLNTMLKLSPDETQKLQAVAKGTDPSQRGWGRYLPI